MLFSVFQLLWDRADPGPFTDTEISNPLPNTPVKKIIAHYGLGDAQVRDFPWICFFIADNNFVLGPLARSFDYGSLNWPPSTLKLVLRASFLYIIFVDVLG